MSRHVSESVQYDLIIKSSGMSIDLKLKAIESKLKKGDLSLVESLQLYSTAFSTLKDGQVSFPATIRFFEQVQEKLNTPCQAQPEIIDRAYVEMGDGLKWATCNVGADKPEDFGDFFAWGMTETYYSCLNPLTWKDWAAEEGYSFLSNKYFKEIDGEYKAQKYNGTDGKTVLEPQDDAATANWGGAWRTPTQEEWARLRNEDNFTWTWETKGEVKGFTVTSKVKGYEGNQIFIPAAGHYVAKTTIFKNFRCECWSSSVAAANNSVNHTHARLFRYGEAGGEVTVEGRYMGAPVRPVSY